MRIPPDPVIDVAQLFDDVARHRRSRQHRLRATRMISLQTGIPLATVQLHLRSADQRPAMITADHAFRWMLWMGMYDIRDYLIEENLR